MNRARSKVAPGGTLIPGVRSRHSNDAWRIEAGRIERCSVVVSSRVARRKNVDDAGASSRINRALECLRERVRIARPAPAIAGDSNILSSILQRNDVVEALDCVPIVAAAIGADELAGQDFDIPVDTDYS